MILNFSLKKNIIYKLSILAVVLLSFATNATAQITALGTCNGITAANENTYNIAFTGLDATLVYNIDLDGDNIAEETGITGVTTFTATDFTYADGTMFNVVQIDEGANGIYETMIMVHEVLCTDADDDGDLDFDVGCDLDLEAVDNGYVVATVAPYVGGNLYVFVLTNAAGNAIAANSSGLFTEVANGMFEVVALNFAAMTDATTFINGLTFGENGTIVNTSTSPAGCSMNCGSSSYTIDCRVDDVALTKVAIGNTANLNIGNQVTFEIEVFNQGTDPIFDIVINDYIPTGFDFFAADNTTNAFSNITADIIGGGTATTTLPGPLASMTSQLIQITLTINSSATNETLINTAEITGANQTQGGLSIFDEDSNLANLNPGTENEDDNNVDDNANDNPNDQDDFDLAGVTLCMEPPLICSDIIENLGPGECETIVHFTDDNFIFCNVGSTISYSPASGTAFPIGNTTVTVTRTDQLGNSTTCDFSVIINEFTPNNNTIACNNSINISLDANCQAVITPDMILEGSNYGCYNDYVIMVLEGHDPNDPQLILPTNNNGFPIISPAYVGDTLTVKITDPDTGNSCWGSIVIEDKTAPVITCNDMTISCDAPAPAAPTATDACGLVTVNMISESIVDIECTGIYAEIITRIWEAVDGSGNTTSCTQVISRERATLSNITFPDNITLNCLDANGTPTDINDLSITGEPSGGCGDIIFNHTDEIISICGGSYKVIRSWLAADWCAPTGNNTITAVQIIKILDSTPPVIDAIAPMTVSTTSNSCTGNILLPTITGTDDCSSLTTPIFSFNGNIISSNTLTNLPLGTHTVDFKIADDCGNETAGSFEIVVLDNFAPLVICDENTTISLTSDGTATVNAAVFDDGSYDNCGIVFMEVRRMNDPCHTVPQLGWKSAAEFCCADIGTTVEVEFRVTDVAGNTNSCMVNVTIEDKLPPTIACPTNKTINCDDDYTNLNLTGEAIASDNCSTVTPSFVDNTNIDDCGAGTITRIWSVTDNFGNASSCVQFIVLENANPFNIVDTECRTTPSNNQIPAIGPHSSQDDVEWPCDIELTTCGLGLEPADLEINYPLDARPQVSENACGTIGVTHEDLQLPIQGDACLKIIRTWTIIDWCQHDVNNPTGGGRWDYVQVIKVLNSQAPTIICNGSDTYIENFEENCGTTFVNLFASAEDDCTPQEDLAFSFVIENEVGTVIQTGNSNNASTTFNNGTYTITWTVTDGCGNLETCTHNFEVFDAKKPTPVCINGLATVLMPSSGMVMLNANTFDSGSSFDNCTTYEDLIFSFSNDVTDTTTMFTCADFLNSDTATVEIWVTDEAGNQDFCVTYILLQDPNGACIQTPTAALNGFIETEEQEQIENVIVDLVGSNIPPITTGANGIFNFPNMAGSNYIVTPEKNINPLNGVTTFDLVLINRHILGIQTLDSPYKMIAADANSSETITTFDMVILRRLILQIDDAFQNNTSWRFVDMAYEFPDATNPWLEDFPEVVNTNGLPANTSVNFIGVKIGDVNGSAAPNNLLGSDTRNFNGTLSFVIENKKVNAGESFDVIFQAKDFNLIKGYQFTLGFDNNTMTFEEIHTELTGLDEGNFGLMKIEEGAITTSWNNAKGIQMENDADLFTLTFKAKQTFNLKEAFSINSRFTVTEAYNNANELLDIQLAFTETEVVDKFELHQNIPNPFRNTTTIGFHLPKAGKATIKIYDEAGRMQKEISEAFVKGYNEILISKEDLRERGFLFYELEFEQQRSTKKMLILD